MTDADSNAKNILPITRTIKVSCLSHFLQEGGCKKCAIPSLHRDTFLAPPEYSGRGTTTLAGALLG